MKLGDFVIKNEGVFSNFYQKGKIIGKGSYGEVRECYRRKISGTRAVKIIFK